MTDRMRDHVARTLVLPPFLLGEPRRRVEPCGCDHWGCRIGFWHCYGLLGTCRVPFPGDSR